MLTEKTIQQSFQSLTFSRLLTSKSIVLYSFIVKRIIKLPLFLNPLNTNPTKRSSTFNQFVGCSHNWSIVVCFKQTILVNQLWFWLRDYLKLFFLILSIFKRINFFYPWNLWFFDDFPGGIEVNQFA